MNLFDNNKVKEEIGIYLSSLEFTDAEFLQDIEQFKKCTEIINNAIYSTTVLERLKQYYKDGLLSPLKLTDDEFYSSGELTGVNKRYNKIYLNYDNDIVYTSAWRPKILHIYDSNIKEEVPEFPLYLDLEKYDGVLYITKGGCCNGDYIQEVHLKETTVKRGCFYPHPPIVIPVSVIIKEDNTYIYSVDCREPKLKSLREYYDVIEGKDITKFDIRKFKKLK